jgi:hypothetical protein
MRQSVNEGLMSGNHEIHHQLLLRLMMRAIDQAELAHEINNACASVAANLTYVGLQSKALRQSKERSMASLENGLAEFDDIAEESLDAIRRCAKSLGQPKTENQSQPVEIQADQLLQRMVACMNDYLPGHGLQIQTRSASKISAVYEQLVSSLLHILLACISARQNANSPEKTRIDLQLHDRDADRYRLSIQTHLSACECVMIYEAIQLQSESADSGNYEVRIRDIETTPIIELSFAAT